MLGFGKYKGKTYEHVYKTDKGYCAWFVENCNKGAAFKKFILEKGLFNRAAIAGKHTTASALAKKIAMDPEIRLFVAELWSTELADLPEDSPEETTQEEPTQEEPTGETLGVRVPVYKGVIANPRRNISPQLYGQFIDYFIRYRLSQALDITFKDKAITSIIKRELPGCEIVSKAMEMLNDPGCSILEQDSKTVSPLVFHNVLRCASAHSIAFDGRRSKTQRAMMELDPVVVSRIDAFVAKVIRDTSPGGKIIQNPNISGSHISADADLIYGSTIVDFKTGKDNIVYYTAQLLIYAVLYLESYPEEEVKNLLIFNPCMEETTINLTLKDGVLDRFSDYLKKLKLL